MTSRVTVSPLPPEPIDAVRADEWAALSADLARGLDELGLDVVWTVGLVDEAIVVTATDGQRATVARTELAPVFDEYLDVVTQLGSGGEDAYSRADALDMAKKATHDRGGRIVKRALRGFGGDLEIARRVFSLALALCHDTSALRAHAALHPATEVRDA